MIAGLLALVLLQTPIDQGTLVIRQDSVDVAHEGFRLTAGRLSAGHAGWSLAATVRYDRVRPVLSLAPILEVDADSLPLALQYDVADPREPLRILGQLGRGRLTVRIIARSMERAREFPATGNTVVLDDSVYAFYVFAAWRAGAGRRLGARVRDRESRRRHTAPRHRDGWRERRRASLARHGRAPATHRDPVASGCGRAAPLRLTPRRR